MNLMIENLTVKVEDKIILDNISLNVRERENYILFGPNGSGKTTLLNAVMGIPPAQVVSGRILFYGEDITKKDVHERAQLGISVGFQNPPEITGVKLVDLLRLCIGKDVKHEFSREEKKLIESFRLTEFLNRDVNVGFSGGERKRADVLQMMFLKPKLFLLDEPDSGVDVESFKLISQEIQRYLDNKGSSALVITHKGDILEYIRAEHACILLNGRLHCFADPDQIYRNIKRSGYEACVNCREKTKEAR
jgi:Fe-S cluster assembly ATP-binding protein